MHHIASTQSPAGVSGTTTTAPLTRSRRRPAPGRRPALIALLGGSMLAGSAILGLAPATAAPAPNAAATVDTQLRITGFAGDNHLTIGVTDLNGAKAFRITDTAPIRADRGCAVAKAVPGEFAVICRAITGSNGGLRSFNVVAGAGNDVVVNNAPASMRADGGAGNDVLRGGDLGDNLRDSSGNDELAGRGGDDDLDASFETGNGTRDILVGGTGSDLLKGGPGDDQLRGSADNDRLEGGAGADDLNPGPGTADIVAYTGGGLKRHVISLDGVANDGAAAGLTGPAVEGDNVSSSTEIVQGSPGPDTMIGNDNANTFEGFDGPDNLLGGRGADVLRGGTGDDRLFSNDFVSTETDGALDRLDGFTGTDHCRISGLDGDLTTACEVVDRD